MMEEEQSTIKYIFNSNDIVELQTYLSEHPTLNLTTIKDQQGNNMDMVRLYVNHANHYFEAKITDTKSIYKKSAKQSLQNWLDQPNPQGFTPFLYAAYNGNHELIRYLLGLGVNYSCQTLTGLNALHMGAQNNKVATFICLLDKISINSLDKNQSTPLHWASYLGSEDVVAFILSQKNIDLNLRDASGQTALFQATFYGNTRIVRRLLMRGGDRNIANNNGQTPLQIATTYKFFNISKMLNDNYTCLDSIKFYCNVKIQYKPLHRSFKYPLLFIIATVYSIAVLNYYVAVTFQYGYVVESCLLGLMILIYLTLLIGPHKYPPKQYSQILMEIHKKFCYQCMRMVPKRSYHCDICHVCIEQYDHHCTWINNCVGKRNIARFIIFIALLVVSLIGIGVVCALDAFEQITSNSTTFDAYFVSRQEYQHNSYLRYLKIALMSMNVLICLFFFPVLLLLAVQVKNLFLNMTTFERFQNKKTNDQSNDSVRNQLQRGYTKVSFKNCRLMCADTKPSFASTHSLEQPLNHQH